VWYSSRCSSSTVDDAILMSALEDLPSCLAACQTRSGSFSMNSPTTIVACHRHVGSEVRLKVAVKVLTDSHGDLVPVQPHNDVARLGMQRRNCDDQAIAELLANLQVSKPALEGRPEFACQRVEPNFVLELKHVVTCAV